MKTKKKELKDLPHQVTGIRDMVHKFRGRCLNADDLGLGKSRQSLRSAKILLGERGNIVVVAEAGLKANWAGEAMKHVGRKVVILEGRTPVRFPAKPPRDQIFVVNYDILGRPGKNNHTWLNWLRRCSPRCVIIDEIQNIKNRDAIRTKGCRELCRRVPYVFGLGGTGAIENCPADAFPFLNICRPDVFNSFYSFAHEFCGPKKTFWGWEFKGATNLGKLHALLKETCMVRRRKEDVLDSLPPVTRVVVPVSLTKAQMEEYKEAETDFAKWLNKRWFGTSKKSEDLNTHRLAQMTYLKQLAGKLKKDFVVRWIADFLATGKKLLAFGWHTDLLIDLHKRFPNSVLLTGKTPSRLRKPIQDKFNTDPKCPLALMNLKAGGAGWSNTSSSTMMAFELPWNPATIKQAGGRNHGIGRGVEGEPNMEFWLVAAGTIDEKLARVLQYKQGIQDAILDGKAEGTSTLNVYDQICTMIAGRK